MLLEVILLLKLLVAEGAFDWGCLLVPLLVLLQCPFGGAGDITILHFTLEALAFVLLSDVSLAILGRHEGLGAVILCAGISACCFMHFLHMPLQQGIGLELPVTDVTVFFIPGDLADTAGDLALAGLELAGKLIQELCLHSQLLVLLLQGLYLHFCSPEQRGCGSLPSTAGVFFFFRLPGVRCQEVACSNVSVGPGFAH